MCIFFPSLYPLIAYSKICSFRLRKKPLVKLLFKHLPNVKSLAIIFDTVDTTVMDESLTICCAVASITCEEVQSCVDNNIRPVLQPWVDINITMYYIIYELTCIIYLIIYELLPLFISVLYITR